MQVGFAISHLAAVMASGRALRLPVSGGGGGGGGHTNNPAPAGSSSLPLSWPFISSTDPLGAALGAPIAFQIVRLATTKPNVTDPVDTQYPFKYYIEDGTTTSTTIASLLPGTYYAAIQQAIDDNTISDPSPLADAPFVI